MLASNVFTRSSYLAPALILLSCLPLASLVHANPIRGAGIDRTTVAIVINTRDPLSSAVGEYYARARQIPAANIVKVGFPVGQSELSVDEFQRIKAEIDSSVSEGVQAYVLTWSAPYRVGCMSITSAFTFGFDPAYCAVGCKPTRVSPYFNSESRLPEYELHIRPSMMLAGRSFADVKALIDRGVESDGSYPRGTAYLLVTKDRARSSRVLSYPQVASTAAGLINIEVVNGNDIRDRQDVIFYFTGLPSVPFLETVKFLPGAIADHLTSFGGMLTDSSQMSALQWLKMGATGSYGAVIEPCNFPQKFPHPAIVIGRYVRGETLIESYWKSVAWPGQGVFIGEPLATPFRLRN